MANMKLKVDYSMDEKRFERDTIININETAKLDDIKIVVNSELIKLYPNAILIDVTIIK